MKNLSIIAFLCVLTFPIMAQDGNATKKYYHNEPMPTDITIPDSAKVAELRAKFMGVHKITLQWLQNNSRDNMGKLSISNQEGKLVAEGFQEELNNGHKNFMRLKGEIFIINETTLLFNGKIEIRVDYTDNGNMSVREGFYVFKKMGKRKYYRMQRGRDVFDQVEYIDIF
jgi:uncharacterized protein YacL (UPF0231 family)